MASSQYTIAEPHPTVSVGSYTHSGRGGAGNTFRMASSAATAAPAARPVKVQRSSKKFYSGIGGAGNAHRAEERAALNFDEEFDRAKIRDSHSVGHVGVGGAGNVFRKHSTSSEDSASSRRPSSESTSSSTGFWGRLSTSSFNRH